MRNRLLALILGLMLSALVLVAFVGYLRPSFIVSVANQIWLCF